MHCSRLVGDTAEICNSTDVGRRTSDLGKRTRVLAWWSSQGSYGSGALFVRSELRFHHPRWSNESSTRHDEPADDKLEFGLDDLDRWPVRFWDVDGGMAAMWLQLAAVDAGLDTWFFGIGYGEDAVRHEFSIPDDRMMVGLVALGYRADDEQPTGSGTTRKRRPLEDQLHRNSW